MVIWLLDGGPSSVLLVKFPNGMDVEIALWASVSSFLVLCAIPNLSGNKKLDNKGIVFEARLACTA